MTIKEAAILLQERFQGSPWFTMVGIAEEEGRNSIVLYVKSVPAVPVDLRINGWHNFPVIVRKMGNPRPVAHARLRRANAD